MKGLELINETIDQVCDICYTCVCMMRAGLGGQVWVERNATYAQVFANCDKRLHDLVGKEADYIMADIMND